MSEFKSSRKNSAACFGLLSIAMMSSSRWFSGTNCGGSLGFKNYSPDSFSADRYSSDTVGCVRCKRQSNGEPISINSGVIEWLQCMVGPAYTLRHRLIVPGPLDGLRSGMQMVQSSHGCEFVDDPCRECGSTCCPR